MSKPDQPLRNLEMQLNAAQREADEASLASGGATTTTPAPGDAPAIDNEALTLAVRATLEQRRAKKKPRPVARPVEPDRSLAELMATYGRSKPRPKPKTEEEG